MKKITVNGIIQLDCDNLNELCITHDSIGLLKIYNSLPPNIIDLSGQVNIEFYCNLYKTEYIYSQNINNWITIHNIDKYTNLLTVITKMDIYQNCEDILKTRNITYIKKID